MSEETTTDAAREKFTPKQHAGETVGEWLESLPSERRMQMLAGDDLARLTIALGKEFEIAERAATQQGRAQGLLEAAEMAREQADKSPEMVADRGEGSYWQFILSDLAIAIESLGAADAATEASDA